MKKIHTVLFAFLFALLSLTACVPQDKAQPSEVTTALRTTLNSGDAGAASELFTDDGEMLAGFSTPVKGKAAIKLYMEKSLRRQLQFWINSENSTMSGDLAYDEGNYRIRDIARNEDLDTGKYMNVFKRVDGKWKIYRSIFSPNAISRESN
ncbi:MAG: nuclear transport factor 2 family protein [Spongiibacteraceae bacterium]